MITAELLAIGTFVPMLRNLSKMLDKGAEHAKGDADALAAARLAPDMFTLRQQVQLACQHATDAVARLTGEAAGAPEAIGEAYEDLKARIDATLERLRSTPTSAFEGADERTIVFPVTGTDNVFDMKGYEFLRDWAVPHFYFHIVTAYDILRHNGVSLGKRDYVAGVGRYIRPAKP